MIDYNNLWKEFDGDHILFMENDIEVIGERNIHLGPRLDFARVNILVSNFEYFQFCKIGELNIPEEYEFYKRFISGFIHEISIKFPNHIPIMKISIVNAEFDPIESSPRAFEEAGRDAVRKLLGNFQSKLR